MMILMSSMEKQRLSAEIILCKKNNFQLFTATCQMTACHTDKPDDNTNKHKYKVHSDNYFDDSNGFL